MTERARREYAAALRPRYQIADKRDRGRILDQYCRTTGCHRKAPIRRRVPRRIIASPGQGAGIGRRRSQPACAVSAAADPAAVMPENGLYVSCALQRSTVARSVNR